MNILVVCHYGLYQDIDSSFVHNQVREFAKMGHRVYVLIPIAFGKRMNNGKRFDFYIQKAEIDSVKINYVRFFSLSIYGEKFFNTVSAILSIYLFQNNIFSSFKPDIIHAHTLGFDSEIASWLKYKFSCPMVVTTHGSDTSIPYMNGEKKWLCKVSEKADAIVTVSSALREKLFDCGVKKTILTILNGYVLHESEKNNLYQPLKVVQVGNLVPSKRVDVTICAIHRLRERGIPVTLTVIGQGPMLDSLEALCKQKKLTDVVDFTGQVKNKIVLEEMRSSRFFVMASKPEGFGIVYLEAMSSGCITIGTEGEGIADLIINGENGFLVPADDSDAIGDIISWCVHYPELADVVSQKAKESVRNLSWENNAATYLTLFSRLIEGEVL